VDHDHGEEEDDDLDLGASMGTGVDKNPYMFNWTILVFVR
jgi:hypothetical protein